MRLQRGLCFVNYSPEYHFCVGVFIQFCANDPEVFIQAALLAQDYCDAIDLNLGCPQMIAKRGTKTQLTTNFYARYALPFKMYFLFCIIIIFFKARIV